MKNSNNYYASAHLRAVFHLIGLPILLFIVVATIEKNLSLVIPAFYILILGVLQYIRLKNTDSLEHKVYSRTFFDYLKNIVAIAFVAVVLLVAGVMS